MKKQRDFIDWEATGNKLFRLRSDNPHLRRFVCSVNKGNKGKCENEGKCDTCTDQYMDRSISRPELADVFGLTENIITNWESGRTPIGIEDLLFYCKMAKVTIDDILVFLTPKQ